jgi:predicted nicotinamide N-methyase
MSGAPQYTFMAWCSVKRSQGTKKLARLRGTRGETSNPKMTLHVISEEKKGKRKTNEKMEEPVPGDLFWSRGDGGGDYDDYDDDDVG